jgi:hypothetical protein
LLGKAAGELSAVVGPELGVSSILGLRPASGTPQKPTLVLRQSGLGGVSEELASDFRGIFAEPPGAAPEVAFEARDWCEA